MSLKIVSCSFSKEEVDILRRTVYGLVNSKNGGQIKVRNLDYNPDLVGSPGVDNFHLKVDNKLHSVLQGTGKDSLKVLKWEWQDGKGECYILHVKPVDKLCFVDCNFVTKIQQQESAAIDMDRISFITHLRISRPRNYKPVVPPSIETKFEKDKTIPSFHESRNIQLKWYPGADRDRKLKSKIEHDLRDYVSAFSKVDGGGQIFLGLEEVKEKKSGNLTKSKGQMVEEKTVIQNYIEYLLAERMCWLEQGGSIAGTEDIKSYFAVTFHPLYNPDGTPAEQMYVIEVSVARFYGMVFTSAEGPKVWKIGADGVLYNPSVEEWCSVIIKEDSLEQIEEEVASLRDTTTDSLDRVGEEVASLKDSVKAHFAEKPKDPILENLKRMTANFIENKTRQQHVWTRNMQEILDILKKDGCCVISGNPGEGKSTVAATIMKEQFYQDRCLILTHAQDWKHVDTTATDIVFVDDIFGIIGLDQKKLYDWMSVLDVITDSIGMGRVKVLFATKLNILNECQAKLNRFSPFTKCIQLSSSKLSSEEKVKMLSECLKFHGKRDEKLQIERYVHAFQSPLGFPVCCFLFSSIPSLYERKEVFFRNPYKFFRENLEALDDDKFAALAFLFCRGGIIQKSKLNENMEMHCNELQSIVDSRGMDTTLKPSRVRKLLEQMNNTYVVCEHGYIQFVHNTVLLTTGLLYGRNNPKYVIGHCSADFLYPCVRVTAGGESEDQLVIEEEYWEILAERLIWEVIERKEIRATAAHSALHDKNFLKKLFEVLSWKDCMKDFLTQGPDPQLLCPVYEPCHFLCKYALAISDTRECFSLVFYLLGDCHHDSVDCWKCDLRKCCLNLCCAEGKKEAYQELLRHGAVPKLDTVNCCAENGEFDMAVLIMEKHEIKPDRETLRLAIESEKVDNVINVISCGAVPDAKHLDQAILVGNIARVVVPMLRSGSLWYSTVSTTTRLDLATGETKSTDYQDEHYANAVDFVQDGGDIHFVHACEVLQKGNIILQKEDFDTFNLLLDKGAVPDSSILNYLALTGNEDIVTKVLQLGAAPDANTVTDAVRGGNIEVVKAVIKNGALPSKETVNMAIEGSNSDVIRALRKNQVLPDPYILKSINQKGKIDIVKELLHHGPEVDIETLSLAVQIGNLEIVKKLLEMGVKPDTDVLNCAVRVGDLDILSEVLHIEDKPSTTTLNLAVQGGNFSIFKKILRCGGRPNAETLNLAVAGHSAKTVEAVLQAEIEPDTETLQRAVCGGDDGIVKVLLERGCEPSTDHLNRAIKTGRVAVVKTLLGRGVKPSSELLNIAVREGNIDVVREIMRHGGVPDSETEQCAAVGERRFLTEDMSGRKGTIYNKDCSSITKLVITNAACIKLNCAAVTGNQDYFQSILDQGTIPDVWTAQCAAWGGNMAIMQVVLDHDIKADTTTLFWAVKGGNINIVRAVIEQGAVPDKMVLEQAIVDGNYDVIQAVLQTGVEPDTKILNTAIFGGNISIVKALLEAGAAPGEESLTEAALAGNEEIYKEVLGIKEVSPSIQTLNAAAGQGHINVFRLLLKSGLEPDIETLNNAAEACNLDIIEAILRRGVIPDSETLRKVKNAQNLRWILSKQLANLSPAGRFVGQLNPVACASIVSLVLKDDETTDELYRKLNSAAIAGNKQCFQSCLDDGAFPDVCTTCCAAFGGDIDIIQLVYDLSIQPETFTLLYAVWGGNIIAVRTVMEHGACPDKKVLDLAVALDSNDILEQVFEALPANIQPDTLTLNRTLAAGFKSNIMTVIDHKPVPDAESVKLAVLSGEIDIFNKVMELQGGYDLNAVRCMCSALDGNSQLVLPVLASGTKADSVTLMCAARGGNLDIFNAVVEKEVYPNRDSLYAAVVGGNEDIMNEISQFGIQLDIPYSILRLFA